MTAMDAEYLDGDHCSHWPAGQDTQCGNPAEGFLITPDRTRAWPMCLPCGNTILSEYSQHVKAVGGIWRWGKGEPFGGPNPGHRYPTAIPA